MPAIAQETGGDTASSANARYAKPGVVKLPPKDEYTDTYQNPDGSFTAVIASTPVRQQTPEGWKDLDGRMQSPDAVEMGQRRRE